MSHILVNVLIIIAATIGLTWAISMSALLAATVRAATRRRRDRCACGRWHIAHPDSWVWAAGVLHEQGRCQPDRESV